MVARKPLRELTRWSTKRNSGRSGEITLVAIHESVGMLDAWDLTLFCERRGVSYNDIADLNTMVHTVRLEDTAWHLRDGCNRSIGLCLTTPTAGYSRAQWLGPQLAKVEYAAWWVARMCSILKLPIRHCNHAQLRDALRGNKGSGGVITHNDYTMATRDGTHTDPRNFPMDVCIRLAKQISHGSEDDMAQVPQAEWNDVRNMVRTMYGAAPPEDRHVARRVDAGYVHNQVWDHLELNSQGVEVSIKHIIIALEERINQIAVAITELKERIPPP